MTHPVDQAAAVLKTNAVGLARLLGVTKGAVAQWKLSGRKVPVMHCVAIESMTTGAVTRKDLRPDDWQLIWPELATVTPCPRSCCTPAKFNAHSEPQPQ